MTIPPEPTNPCCCCIDGAVIDRWLNGTLVRPKGDSGGTHYTASPYQRLDQNTHDAEYPHSTCATLLPGTCGLWLDAGDLNGIPSNVIDALVDDIMTCAAADGTHYTKDHNCYNKSGTTIDARETSRFGGKWCLGKTFWHGMFPLASSDLCAPNPNDAPQQVKYRTITFDVSLETHFYDNTDSSWYDRTGSISGGSSVDRKSGIVTSDVSVDWTKSDYHIRNAPLAMSTPVDPNILSKVVTDISGCSGTVKSYDQYPGETDPTAPPHLVSTQTYSGNYTSFLDSFTTADWYCGSPVVPDVIFGADVHGNPNCTLAGIIDWWNAGYGHAGFELPAYTSLESYSGTRTATYDTYFTDTITLSWTRTGTVFDFSVEYHSVDSQTDNEHDIYSYVHGSVTLSDPYTAAEWLQDLYDAMNAWDLSDGNLGTVRPSDGNRSSWRLDEELALAQLCGYDEVPFPVSPFSYHCMTMDDYSGSLTVDYNQNNPGDPGYVPTWTQRTWIDSNDHVWRITSGTLDGVYFTASSIPADFTTAAAAGTPMSCELITPLRDGSIISHTTAGSERHWWFKYLEKERVQFYEGGTGGLRWEWFDYMNGGKSDPLLPETTMRWMDNDEAQYDGAAYRGADGVDKPGNFPQSFLKGKDGVLVAGKFVVTDHAFKSVNYGRPCGIDRYAVDQPTVCCVMDATGFDPATGGDLVVKKTGNAILPLATGGLQAGDYIMVSSDGIYKISAIVDDGVAYDSGGNAYEQFTITVGGRIDTLPAGVEGLTGGTITHESGTAPTGVLTATTPDPDDADRTLISVAVTPNGNTIQSVNIYQVVGSVTTLLKTDASDPYTYSMLTSAYNHVTSFTFSINYIPGSTVSAGDYLGRLRFPRATGNLGLLACTTDFAGVTLTIHADATAAKYVRFDPTDGSLSLNLYDSSKTFIERVAATRIGDDFTCTPTTATSASYFWHVGHKLVSAAWIEQVPEDYAAAINPATKRTDVHLTWTFNQRKAAAAAVVKGAIDTSDPDRTAIQAAYEAVYGSYPPTWYAATDACLDCTIDQYNYALATCHSVTGILPPGASENFTNENLFAMLATGSFVTDDIWGSHWQSAVEIMMPDPFWQAPFAPDCVIILPDVLRWTEDDGSGSVADYEELTDGGAVIYHKFYAHQPMVEAASEVPSGMTLPDGVTLPLAAPVAPPHYPYGLPIGDEDGNYGSFEMPWGLMTRVCGAARFAADYAAWTIC